MALDRTAVSERILAIGERLLNEGGSSALQARAIAGEAGVSVGTVYNLFGDLDDLHRAVNVRLLDRLGAAGVSAVAEFGRRDVTGVRERLLMLARTYMDFVEDNAGAWSALLAFNRAHAPEARPDWYVSRLNALFDIIAAVLAEGDFGLDERARATAARALWSSVHGIVTSGYAGYGGETGQNEIWRQIDLLVTIFVFGLGAGAAKTPT
jgi:AcrR family transcriptional regulator